MIIQPRLVSYQDNLYEVKQFVCLENSKQCIFLLFKIIILVIITNVKNVFFFLESKKLMLFFGSIERGQYNLTLTKYKTRILFPSFVTKYPNNSTGKHLKSYQRMSANWTIFVSPLRNSNEGENRLIRCIYFRKPLYAKAQIMNMAQKIRKER